MFIDYKIKKYNYKIIESIKNNHINKIPNYLQHVSFYLKKFLNNNIKDEQIGGTIDGAKIAETFDSSLSKITAFKERLITKKRDEESDIEKLRREYTEDKRAKEDMLQKEKLSLSQHEECKTKEIDAISSKLQSLNNTQISQILELRKDLVKEEINKQLNYQSGLIAIKKFYRLTRVISEIDGMGEILNDYDLVPVDDKLQAWGIMDKEAVDYILDDSKLEAVIDPDTQLYVNVPKLK
jgi:hypothetical protein